MSYPPPHKLLSPRDLYEWLRMHCKDVHGGEYSRMYNAPKEDQRSNRHPSDPFRDPSPTHSKWSECVQTRDLDPPLKEIITKTTFRFRAKMAAFRRKKYVKLLAPPTLPNHEPASTTARQHHTTNDDPEIPTLDLQKRLRSRSASTNAAPDITLCGLDPPISPATSEPPRSEMNGLHKPSVCKDRKIDIGNFTPPKRSLEDKPTGTPVVQSATEQPIAMFLRATDLVEITLRPVSEKDLKKTPAAKNDGPDFELSTSKTNNFKNKAARALDSAVSQGVDRKIREFSGLTLYEPFPSPPALSKLSSVDSKTAQSVSERIDTEKKIGVGDMFSTGNLPDARNPFSPGFDHDHDHRRGQDTDLPARSRKSYDHRDEKTFTVRGSSQSLQETNVNVSNNSHASDPPTNITESMSHEGESAQHEKSGAWVSSSGSSSPNISHMFQTSKPSWKDGIPACYSVKSKVATRDDMKDERPADSSLDSTNPKLTNANPYSQLHMMTGESVSAPIQNGTSSTAGVVSGSSRHDSTTRLEQSEPETEERYDTLFSTPTPTIANTRAALAKLAEESVRSLELQNAICNDPDLELPWRIMMHKAQQRETVRRLLEESERLRSISETSFGHRNQLSQSPLSATPPQRVFERSNPTNQFAPTTHLDETYVPSPGGKAQNYAAEVGPCTPPGLPKQPRRFNVLHSHQALSSSSDTGTGLSEDAGSPFLMKHDSAREFGERKDRHSNRIVASPTISRSRLQPLSSGNPLPHRIKSMRFTSARGILLGEVSDLRAASYTVRKTASRMRNDVPFGPESIPDLKPRENNYGALSDRSSSIDEESVAFHIKPWSPTKKPTFSGTVPNPPVPPSTHFGRRCVTSPATSSSPLLQDGALHSYGSMHSALDTGCIPNHAPPRISDLITNYAGSGLGEVDPGVEIVADACTEMATIKRTLDRAAETIVRMEGIEEKNDGKTEAPQGNAAGSINGHGGRIDHSYGSKASSIGRKWTVSIAPGKVSSLRRRFEDMRLEFKPRGA
ncbi:hypothetical protein BKA63DRAFT_594839 [Paraphoma chrysanthemicola]|nr:hypothetical protein BKA63DRAFT_594839 [Paraphoma chrysanthemicola]